MDNFVYFLEFKFAKRLKAHSQAIPENKFFYIYV